MEIMEAMFGAGWPSSSALILSLTPSAGAGVDLSQREVKVVDKQVVCKCCFVVVRDPWAVRVEFRRPGTT